MYSSGDPLNFANCAIALPHAYITAHRFHGGGSDSLRP